MPWCEHCSRFWNPNSMGAAGTCPTCGRTIAAADAPTKVPWHFKLLVLGIVLYLAFRAYQGIVWVLSHV